jgi:Ca2+-transporting ATPase
MALNAMTLCNNMADPLEISLLNYVRKSGIDHNTLIMENPRTYEVPFTSENKYMLTVNTIDGIYTVLLKGAPEIVMDCCDLPPEERRKISATIEGWASSGLKLLALAYKQNEKADVLTGFTWLGLIGMEDPVRPGVRDAIALCRDAGIKVKIVTGDYKGTALKVAHAIGLDPKADQVIEGKQLETIQDSELVKIIGDLVVFCRVSPHHKLKIVNALQMRGEVTAMIGDGVNDAPALKKSNIGISVGTGTDVAQETAGLILLDGNFKTLVDSVEEGRIIFDNIKKVVAYVLSNSFAEIFTIFGAMLLGWPSPLSVVQILWIHLICDGPSDIVLGFERGEAGIMTEKPKSLKESILDRPGKLLIFCISLASAILSLTLYWYVWQMYNDLASANTIVFTVLAIQELVYIFAYRSFRHSVFRSGKFFSNKSLIGAVVLGFSQQLLALYVPVLNNVLGVVPLHLTDWLMVLSVAFGMLLIVETVKSFLINKTTWIDS